MFPSGLSGVGGNEVVAHLVTLTRAQSPLQTRPLVNS